MMQESVTYQDILSKGKQQEALSLITRLLNRRLGNVSDTEVERLRGLSIEELEALGEALLDFTSVADLTSTAVKSKVKSQKSKVIWSKLFND